MSCAGLRMIQLLPVNDTSVYNMWWDSYPYSSVSVSLVNETPTRNFFLIHGVDNNLLICT